MSVFEDLSREELIALAREQDARIVEQDARIAELVDRVARLEHLLSRNSSNSSMPPSRDDDVGSHVAQGEVWRLEAVAG